MASEYSCELSVKVFAGQCRLIEMGFRQGGPAGYGLRRMLIEEDLPLSLIAKRLNASHIRTDLDREWTSSTVRQVLTNEKYIGNNVYNRRSFKLKKKHVNNPPDMWIRKEGAYEGVVSLDNFMRAQEILADISRRLSDEELLEHLKRLYES
jgi:hypothetical protein